MRGTRVAKVLLTQPGPHLSLLGGTPLMITSRFALSLIAALALAFASTACGEDDRSGYSPYSPTGSSGSSGSSGTSGSSGSSADEHPAWLEGTSYTKGYKTENNIAFESEDVGIKFNGAPDYKYEEKVGKSWTKPGTWKVTNKTTLVLSGGETISLSTAMTANCKILKRSSGKILYTTDKVEGCPTAKPLSAAECAKVGTYSKGTQSGTSSSSHSTSTTYELDAEGVLIYTTGSSQSTCYGSTCKSLTNASAPVVGRWWLSGTTVQSDSSQTVSLTGFEFTKSTEPCGGK